MKDIKMLVFDVDGTLVARGNNKVEASALQAINEARAKGIQILIATGRSYFFIIDHVKEVICPDYYVTVNGSCLIGKDEKVIERYDIPKDIAKRFAEYCRKHEYPVGFKYADGIGTYAGLEAFIKPYIGLDHPGKKFIFDDYDYSHLEKEDPLGIFLIAPTEYQKEIQKEFPELVITIAYDHAYDIYRVDVDKTKTIESVMNKLGIQWDQVISFGDGENDIEMLQKAGIGVAMGNASDLVKQHADYITDNILDDGILKAFKHLHII